MKNIFVEPVNNLFSSLTEEATTRCSDAVLDAASPFISEEHRDAIVESVVSSLHSVFGEFRAELSQALGDISTGQKVATDSAQEII